MANLSKNMKALTSLDFVEFTSKRIGSTNLPEGAEKLVVEIKSVEQELIEALKKRNINEKNKDENVRFYRIYLRLGHINLLAEDFPKALSAYQKSYKSNKDEFWRDPAALYGLAITYYHFRAYNPAIELFCQLLFSHPYCEANTEVHARLGLSFKSLENYSQALKHLNIALDHAKECPVLPKSFLRFQVAHCLDIAGEIRKAVEEYRRLLADHDRGIVPLSNQLLAAIYSRLGWISLYSREREPKEEVRLQKLKEAEALLLRARELCSVDSKANQYLGLCYSEQTRVANKLLESGLAGGGDQQQQSAQQQGNGQQQHPHNHHPRYNADQAAQNAFISYRTAIDSDESDANTWRSIGILYQQQNQPFDALQAFACAVQLNDKHYAAWSNLGQLYEKYRQYKETLFCYKKALQANPESPEQLRLRIAVIEKELSQIGGPANYSLLAQQQLARRGDTTSSLHPIESAWQLDIPAQVRQRLAEHKKQQENKYREGSPLFNMHDLIASSMAIDADDRSLTPTQRQILQILKLNKDQLEMHETTLLRELEQRVADEEPSQEGSGNEAAGEKHAGDDESSVKSTKQHQSQRQQTALDQQSLGDAHHPPSTSKSNQPPNASTSSSSSADPAITNLVFPSSMLSPKEEPQQEELAKSAAAIAATETANGQQIQEEKISSTSQHPHELPPQFSLLAPVNMPITVTSSEVLEMCKKRCAKPEEYKPIFDENVPPPKPPTPPAQTLAKEKLLLKTPVILVENQRDAMSMELQQFCYNQPIVLIHGLTLALKIDLSQFSTKTLIQTAADHEVEVRTQFKMPYDVNVDQMGNPTWFCKSSKSFTTISRYGQYQAESFKHSLKEETEKLRQTNPKLYGPVETQTPLPDGSSPVPTKKRKTAAGSATRMGTPTRPNGAGNEENNPYKMIKFGTNIDLSDEKKFYFQLRELNKLPPFCRLSSASNMLSYLGHTVLGMNTVQLYLKVPGCRTPGHLENNSFASVNVNIGPGECEWFGVPYDYWPTIERMCKERGIDFLRGAWWPHVADLVNADVPFYRFTQRAGDCVFVNGGCVHWVQSTGWCNNVAWNVGPMTANQMEMALTAHEWNRLNSYQSLVPMQHLCWSLARDVRFSNQKLYNQVKNMLIRSLAYCQMLVDFVGVAMKSPIKKQQRQKGECAYFCHLCEIEVFNLLFVKEIGGRWKIFCVQCARQNNLDDYVVLQQYTFEELQLIFDRFQLHPAKSSLIC